MSALRRHPGVRSGKQLTVGERAADRMRNGFGSWTFLAFCLLFIGSWILAVTRLALPIDNPQLTILNLVLSTFAALQGGIILLAAKRSDRTAGELAAHTFEVDQQALAKIEENTEICMRLLEHFGITIEPDASPAVVNESLRQADRSGFFAQPTVGGYKGSTPASEVGPPPKTPSASARPDDAAS